MLSHKLLDELGAKLGRAAADSPAGELEKNMRAVLQTVFAKLDLVSREEFEVQQAVLLRTREKLENLGAQVAILEKQTGVVAGTPADQQKPALD